MLQKVLLYLLSNGVEYWHVIHQCVNLVPSINKTPFPLICEILFNLDCHCLETATTALKD